MKNDYSKIVYVQENSLKNEKRSLQEFRDMGMLPIVIKHGYDAPFIIDLATAKTFAVGFSDDSSCGNEDEEELE